MRSRTRAWAATALLALVGMVLAGCSLLSPNAAHPTPSPSSTVKVMSLDIKVGDCLDDATVGSETATAQLVSCDGPHDSETFAEFTMKDAKYPGDDAVQSQAQADCSGTAFAQFIGIASSDSTLQVSYYFPTSDTWQGGDRTISCTVYQIDQAGKPLQTTGTLKNSAK
jgi:hypothetical protein